MKNRIRMLLLLTAALILAAAAAGAEEEYWGSDLDFDEYIREYRKYISAEGDVLVLKEGVVTLGSYYGEWNDSNSLTDEKDPAVTALFRDCVGFSLSGDTMDEELPDYDSRYFSAVRWPSTLRMLGTQSFHVLGFGTMTLPASLERIEPDAFIYCSIGTLRIECELPFEMIRKSMYDSWIDAYDASEDNALYKAVDGVLYSRDGKTLIAYPNIRKDEHFDVPAGVEHIGAYAFSNNENLKTISLPVGLKTVGNYAFADCTRLQAIAVPLTVEHIGPGVFYDCVSLERVSLPEGLEADKDDTWAVYYPDDRIYRGDNGNTFDTGGEDKQESKTEWIDADFCWIRDGEQVPVYADREGTEVVSSLSGGTPVTACRSYLDRALVQDPLTLKEIGWVDTGKLDLFIPHELFYLKVIPTAETSAKYKVEEGFWNEVEQLGPWICSVYTGKRNLLFPLEAVELYRYPDPEYENDEFGIIADQDALKRLALLDAPDGNEVTVVHVGIQVRILEVRDEWALVTTGYDEGWIRKEQIRIIPEMTYTEEK